MYHLLMAKINLHVDRHPFFYFSEDALYMLRQLECYCIITIYWSVRIFLCHIQSQDVLVLTLYVKIHHFIKTYAAKCFKVHVNIITVNNYFCVIENDLQFKILAFVTFCSVC